MTASEINANRLGLSFVVDTNVVIDHVEQRRIASVRLHEFADDGWIELTRTDGVDTERTAGASAHVARQRLEETARRYPVEVNGAMVWDHSRWDHAEWADESDDHRIDRILELIFGHRNRSVPRELHDAMAVATTVKYGHTHFVTSDKKILNAGISIQKEFNTQVLNPEKAVEFVERMIARWECRPP